MARRVKVAADEAEVAAADTASEVREDAQEDNVVPISRNIFDRSKYNYAKNGVKTSTGRASVDNNDAVAVALRGKTADDCVALVEANGLEIPEGWASKNAGMRRMNAANVLRRLAKSDEGVMIDGQHVKLPPKDAA